MSKIGFTGTQNVGKTTLVKILSTLPVFEGYRFSTERSKYLQNLGIPLNTDSTIKGQTIFLAERCSELLYENIIVDRTILDVIAYSNCAKSITRTNKALFEMYSSSFINEYDWIFYVTPDGVAMEDNGVRALDLEYRTKIDIEVKHLLDKYSSQIKNFGIISGSSEERLKQITSYIKM